MAWSYTVKEINKPSLTEIRVSFVLKLDGNDYCPDEIRMAWAELDGKTNAEKLTYIKEKIRSKIDIYLKVYAVADGLQQYVGATVTVT
jgi:hypothetical protein